MTPNFKRDVAFPSALELALEVIVDMQKTLNKYKLKKDANAKWIEERQQSIALLLDFTEVSKETFSDLVQEIKLGKDNAFKLGYEKAQKEFQFKEQFGNLNFDNSDHKEQIRAASILNAQEKWNF